MTYYKATRPDGTDFRTGTMDYGSALETGEVIRHGSPEMIHNRPDTYLSVSVEPTGTIAGGSWPCRLFEVEPVGTVLDNLTAHPHKRAVSALRVVRELDAWRVFGPHGHAVADLIERCRTLTPEQARSLSAARDAGWGAAWDAALDAAWGAAWGAVRDAAWDAAWGAARGAAWEAALDAARGAARDAALALVVRDRITPEQFDTLYGPWASVMER